MKSVSSAYKTSYGILSSKWYLFVCIIVRTSCIKTDIKILNKKEYKNLCEYSDKTILVVNTASKCGYTYRYEELEALHRRFGSEGFTVLGFPSRNFLWQEYSDQKFGFSIQLSKWRKYQKKFDESFDVIKYQKKFAESVGWYKTNKWLSWADERFGNNAKMKKDGLLPIPPPFKKDMSHSVELMPQLAKKIEECQGNHFCSED